MDNSSDSLHERKTIMSRATFEAPAKFFSSDNHHHSISGTNVRVRPRVEKEEVLPMVRSRHPRIADIMVCHLEGVTQSPCLGAASNAAAELDGLDVPWWSALADGLRPPPRS